MEVLHTLVDWIVQTVVHWGYPGIIVMMFLESSFFPFRAKLWFLLPGIWLPGEKCL